MILTYKTSATYNPSIDMELKLKTHDSDHFGNLIQTLYKPSINIGCQVDDPYYETELLLTGTKAFRVTCEFILLFNIAMYS